jgi:signal transduction histidine kinase
MFRSGAGRWLVPAWLGLLGLGLCAGGTAAAAVLTNTAAVLALTPEEAARALPVRLRAVVVDRSEPADRALTVADESGGLYVLSSQPILAPFHPRDVVELEGVSDPGEFAPIMRVTAARKVGTAPLPVPRRASYHEIISGSLDAQWIEVEGVIQATFPPAPGSQVWRMIVSVDGGTVHVRQTGPRDPALLPDAAVRIRALCFYQFNQRRQLLNPVLQVPAGTRVEVLRPAPADPFAGPPRPAASLQMFSPRSAAGHRVHVRGVVLHGQPDGWVYLRDETSGLRFHTRATNTVEPGDVLDVVGFPKFGAASPVMVEAEFRRAGRGAPPAPLRLSNPVDAFDHENNLVEVEADLAAINPVIEGLMLTLQAGDLTFKAVLKQPLMGASGRLWQAGSRVRVAGICSVAYDDERPIMGIWHPQSFQLLLRSPADVAVVRAPPWWTAQRAALVLAAVLAMLLLGMGFFAWVARRRLVEQERQRALAEREFSAILAERNRMAREIHDTLAQGLAATSVQLRLARKQAGHAPEELGHHLDAAQELVRSSLEEARNSIWNMRPQVLETGDLAAALEGILRQMAEGTELRTAFEVKGRRRRLAPVIENNLLRVGQEAITNAARHASATELVVTLEFGERDFHLVVRDNGRGFDPATSPPREGGFGLVGMRARADELRGELVIRSAPGQGTEIALRVPLAGAG